VASRSGHFALALLAFPLVVACASIPPGRPAVDAVDFQGVRSIGESDLADHLATTASPRFLGIWEGVLFDYEFFDRNVFQRDLARVERFYRARGFYQAQARAGRVESNGTGHVRVTIVVEEGPPVLIRSISLPGAETLPWPDTELPRTTAARELKLMHRFDEDGYDRAETAVRRALRDAGYAYAKVKRSADVDIVTHFADVTLTIEPGPRARFGPITIEGLGSIPEAPVRRAIDIDEGQPFSQRAIEAAEMAVLDLGVFAAANIEPEIAEPPPAEPIVPLHVRVEASKLRSVTIGGGLELDAIKSEGHLRAGWQDLNFLGGLRSLTIEAKPGLVFYPTRIDQLEPPTDYLPEAKLHATLRQPGFLEARTSGVLHGEFNTYPLILQPITEPGEPVIGYREARASAGLDRTVWKLYVNPSYNVQASYPFAYVGGLDPALTSVIISYATFLAQFDARDNKMTPHRGVYLSNDLQFAGLGGDARDVRERPEARIYVPMSRRITLAMRAAVGFLFPFNYGSTLEAVHGGAPTDETRSAWTRDEEITYFRGFFSGGPDSNRGYPWRGIGPHGVVPFFAPTLALTQLAYGCLPGSATYDPARCAIPLGGWSLWEASAEFRLPMGGPVTSALFCDASDVSPNRFEIRLNHPHLSCGTGLRYETPVGLIRLDVGYRVPGLQVLEPYNVRDEGDPGTPFNSGIPIAIAFGLGEPF
jgi:outer membrane protein insertion porin family/translocation and assembly module TamA